MKILVFGGTSDGNIFVNHLNKRLHTIYLSVATEYGKLLAPQEEAGLSVLSGRLNVEEIQAVIREKGIECVIDATHPYAVEVSKNIRKACKETECSYNRLLREKSIYEKHVIHVESIEEACEKAAEGNVLATTGSKQIAEYMHLKNYKDRLYARVLPTEESVGLCKKAGMRESHIITSAGVLSQEENIEMIQQYDIKTLITKDGGEKGGFQEKSEACKLANIKLLVLNRPCEIEGYTLEEMIKKYQ